MNWYVAKLVFRITAAHLAAVGQFDEQLRLIRAETLEKAYVKARLLGIAEEDNAGEVILCREFVNVAALHALDDLQDGTEVQGKVREVEGAGAYVQWVHQRAASLVS